MPGDAPRSARAAAALGAWLASCGGARSPHPPTLPPAFARHALAGLVGEWTWSHAGADGEVAWIERERWAFVEAPSASDGALRGRYQREVLFTSSGEPFACNQSQRYVQRSQVDVSASLPGAPAGGAAATLELVETAYRAEVSPCDHGFRNLGTYQAELGPTTAVLRFAGGSQTLLRVGPAPRALADARWPGDAPTLAGAWTWQGTIVSATERRTQQEAWSLTVAADGTVSGTTTRHIEIRDPSGGGLACAGGAPLRIDETVTLTGQPDEDRTLLREVDAAVTSSPTGHTCDAMAGARTSDSAHAELFGDAVVLMWRGKRRQVLIRPVDAAATSGAPTTSP